MNLDERLRDLALVALETILRDGSPLSPASQTATVGNVSLTVFVRLAGSPVPLADFSLPIISLVRLTPCQRDVLQLLTNSHPQRKTCRQVRAELEARQQIWGESTIEAALTSLRHAGLLLNARDCRGYGISADGLARARDEGILKSAS